MADPPSSSVTICSISSASNAATSVGGSASVSGMRSTMPSSEWTACTSMP